jgi:chemotaxis receptor (MCP) glutamine deamidase CheD
MKIFIKNMVCQGTRKFVLMEIKRLGLSLKTFEMDELEFQSELSAEQVENVISVLKKYGLEVMAKNNRLANEVKIGFNPPEPRISVKKYVVEKNLSEMPVLTGQM